MLDKYFIYMLNIKNQLNNLPNKKILSYATAVSDELSIPSYLVGGYVRDLILNRKTTDIDIMVEGNGVLFAKKLAEKLNVDNIVIYEKFQTALIPLKEIQIEIATARVEEYDLENIQIQLLNLNLNFLNIFSLN